MDKEQFFLVSSLIVAAARMAGLDPTSRGNFDGDETVWSWRWLDAPETIIAVVAVHVRPDEVGEGAEIKVSSASYDYDDRTKSYSRLYWGRYIEYKYLVLDKNMEDVASEVKEGLSRAWQDLPQQVASLPKIIEERDAFRARLKNMGLLW